MKYWFRGQRGGLMAFLVIASLVVGGLGWATSAALRLEREQREVRARAELYDRLRLALWRLDSRISPVLAREDTRPYHDFTAVFAPPLALRQDGTPWPSGTILQVSPLVNAELPDWVLLHFQADADTGWASPQVLSKTLSDRLARARIEIPSADTAKRAQFLKDLAGQLSPQTLLTHVQQKGAQSRLEDTALVLSNTAGKETLQFLQAPPNMPAQQTGVDPEYLYRAGQQNRFKLESKNAVANDDPVVIENFSRNGERWFAATTPRSPRSEQVTVSLGSMTPMWLTTTDGQERLFIARLVRIGGKEVCQGLVLDWPRLQELLGSEVQDLFADAQFQPVRDEPPPQPERTMTALPVQLEAGLSSADVPPAWTALRIGLTLAWTAALVALVAVGLGGWSLIDLSERRIRFVSAVTHELRTPLTTLRLYLDMLTGGIVTEEKHKAEYLQTLHAETERLNRLVGNVLDFSRLENQRPRLEKAPVALSELLEQVRTTWQARCAGSEKELVVDNGLTEGAEFDTDGRLLQQILGNLIDNACKYSRGAADNRIWLRVRAENGKRMVLEVEDRGPGVARNERHAIFRAFRRGRGSEVTAGGVGLGLALARRWAQLLGGRLTLQSGSEHAGACFRLELPVSL